MVNGDKQHAINDRSVDDVEVDLTDHHQSAGGDSSVTLSSSSALSSSASVGEASTSLDGDLLPRLEGSSFLQWLQALDVQVMGACRADERLKPLLKLNAATGAAEDRLLAHLSQHFEPAEIGMLARCLYVPLVSIRVGKINKQGNLLCPTDKRGSLSLTLLPTSDMWLSFVGDDGHTERLSTLSCDHEFPTVEVEGIPADKSGRSFLINIRQNVVFYFWCAEKSKLLGVELLRKMKDLLTRKPSLAELTGISESRLDSFAVYLRAYFVGSALPSSHANHTPGLLSSLDDSLDSLGWDGLSPTTSMKSSRSRHSFSQSSKSSSFDQGSLSPRSSSFKEGTPRHTSSLRSAVREKFKHGGDGYLSCLDSMSFASTSSLGLTSSNLCEKDKPPKASDTCLFPPVSSLESLEGLVSPSLLPSPTQVSSSCSQLISPYYCWCPPVTASIQYTKSSSQLPVSSLEPFSLPPLSSLLSSARSSGSLLSSTPPMGSADFPALDLLPLIPEPLVRSQLAIPSSQQIPTFTPLMCDPIVHIPVIDVCSSGQGLLVSAGPAISTTIPPLLPNLVSPLLPEAESVVEKGARETLRWLISSSSNSPSLPMDVLPLPSLAVNGDEKHMLAAGSRGLYVGTEDLNALTKSIPSMDWARLTELPSGSLVTTSCSDSDDGVVDLEKKPSSCVKSSTMAFDSTDMRDEGTE